MVKRSSRSLCPFPLTTLVGDYIGKSNGRYQQYFLGLSGWSACCCKHESGVPRMNIWTAMYQSMIIFSVILFLLCLSDPAQILYRPYLMTYVFYSEKSKARTASLLTFYLVLRLPNYMISPIPSVCPLSRVRLSQAPGSDHHNSSSND